MPNPLPHNPIVDMVEIDDDHRRIVECYVHLHDALVNHASNEVISGLLTDFVEVVIDHIQREADIMDAINYGHTEAHNAAHNRFISLLSKLAVDYQISSHILLPDLIFLLNAFQNEHITQFDLPLVAAYKSRGGVSFIHRSPLSLLSSSFRLSVGVPSFDLSCDRGGCSNVCPSSPIPVLMSVPGGRK